ncbi:MAG: GIY-YIG nuclease family protein [Candidatus Atelocyanobacterium thalassa]
MSYRLLPNNEKGTYCLLLFCFNSTSASIGNLGLYPINLGYYIYVGSAFGAGGLNSRIQRHIKIYKNKHWHLDYLRQYLIPLEVWYSTSKIRQEHEWAKFLLNNNLFKVPVKKFGASDCSCISHLFYSDIKPEFEILNEKIIRKSLDYKNFNKVELNML